MEKWEVLKNYIKEQQNTFKSEKKVVYICQEILDKMDMIDVILGDKK